MSATYTQSSQIGDELDPAACVLESGFNAVLLMPTGSGKTHRAAAAIQRTCQGGKKAVYVTPTRALANELHSRWTSSWPELKVGIFTGDFGTDQDYPVSFLGSDVLIMTPERLDLCTRQWRHHWRWLPQVDLKS